MSRGCWIEKDLVYCVLVVILVKLGGDMESTVLYAVHMMAVRRLQSFDIYLAIR